MDIRFSCRKKKNKYWTNIKVSIVRYNGRELQTFLRNEEKGEAVFEIPRVSIQTHRYV